MDNQIEITNVEQLSLFDNKNNTEYNYYTTDALTNKEIQITGVNLDYYKLFDYSYIVQSNKFIHLYQYHKSGNALQITNFLKSLIRPDDTILKNYVLTRNQIQCILKKSNKHINRDVDKLRDELTQSFIMTYDGAIYPFFTRIHITKEHNLELTLNPFFQQYLIDLVSKGNYTQYNFQNIYLLQLNQAAAIRIYELLLSCISSKEQYTNFYNGYEDISYDVSISKLKKLLGFSLRKTDGKSTPKWEDSTHFINRIIIPALDNINANTNINISMKKVKKANSKKLEDIQFICSLKNDSELKQLRFKSDVSLWQYIENTYVDYDKNELQRFNENIYTELSPNSTELSPNSTELSPNSTELSPNSTELSPNSTELSPNSTELSPNSTNS